jgi:hypothetical protein
MQAQTVQNRGYAGRGALAVVGQGRSISVPERTRPGLVMLFQVVGVDVDEAWRDNIPAPVLGAARRCRPRFNGMDPVVPDDDLPADLSFRRNDRRAIDAFLVRYADHAATL